MYCVDYATPLREGYLKVYFSIFGGSGRHADWSLEIPCSLIFVRKQNIIDKITDLLTKRKRKLPENWMYCSLLVYSPLPRI